jgi:hypothetical protein
VFWRRVPAVKKLHASLTVLWVAMVPIALVTGWVKSIVFISACSIYANAASHFAAWLAAKAEKEAESSGS